MQLYEVFIRSRRGLDHKHVGSLHADDPEQALEYARDVYTRRGEGVSVWVVESRNITASQEADCEVYDRWTTSHTGMPRCTHCLKRSIVVIISDQVARYAVRLGMTR